MNENTVALIPARASSKRIPLKNLKPVCGKPLIYYSIQVALQTPEIKNVFVSTEDDRIAQEASKLGATVITRPDQLSGDDVTNFSVMQHAIEWIDQFCDYPADLLMLLQPTNLFRSPEQLSDAVRAMGKSPGSDSLVSVKPIKKPIGVLDSGGHWTPLRKLPHRLSHSDQHFMINGNLFLLRVNRTLKKDIFLGEKILHLCSDLEEADVDIDYPEDLLLAEFLLRQKIKKYPFFEIDQD